MKLSTTFVATLALVSAQKKQENKLKPDMGQIREVMAEIERGQRADGFALLIQQQVATYLGDQDLARKIMNYGCYCQLLGDTRDHGFGEPVDEIDVVCQTYHKCSKCNAIDEEGTMTPNGKVCDWNNAKYEQTFDVDSQTFVCTEEKSAGDCGFQQCQCDAKLAIDLANVANKFRNKFSSESGFEYKEECKATKPPPGFGGKDFTMACCGTYPDRFPFKETDRRKCCVDKVYTNNKSCCKADGSLGQAGTC